MAAVYGKALYKMKAIIMKLFVTQTRPFSALPKSVVISLLLCLCLQLVWHFSFHKIKPQRYPLSSPPPASLIRLLSLDESITAAKITMLWLQAFDNQPGISLPLRDLNYHQVIKWLDLILKLDKKTQYPLLAAIRFYAEVPDEERQRLMIDYVRQKFIERPDERWASMAHAVYIAKHRIKDLELARQCAALLRHHALGNNVPFWAKQMEFFILEDMGELESASILIGGLLDSGTLNDPHQRRFLGQRLQELAAQQSSATTD